MSIVPILLLGLGGLLVGGVISLHRQGASRFSIGLVAALALLSLTAGVAWLIPGDSR